MDYSKNIELANAIWKRLKGKFESQHDFSVKFDAKHHIHVSASVPTECDETLKDIAQAEKECAYEWNMRVIEEIYQLAKKHGKIKCEWGGDRDTNLYIDRSEYYQFSV